MMKLQLGEKDFEIFDKIKQLMKECEDIDHKKTNIDNDKEEKIINETINSNNINDLLINSNFEEYLNIIFNRGKDNFEAYSVNKDNNILEDFKEKAQKMKYNELFDFIMDTNNKIIINSYLNLFNNNINKSILQDSESKSIFQFNGEIYNIINEINHDNIKNDIDDNNDKMIPLFNLLINLSKEKNKIENISEYIEKFFLII